MSVLARTLARIRPADTGVASEAQRRLDAKTKPRRSLGRLEDVACRVAGIRGSVDLAPGGRWIVVMGADHGVAAEGVSAYPQEVSRQMLLNFAGGGAAINVLARHAGAEVVVVDMGVCEPLPTGTAVRAARIGAGTRNFAHGPAMRREDAIAAIEVGIGIADELARERGAALIGIGEMGIGNTTAASALAAVFTGASVGEVTGRGTGIDEATHARKRRTVADAIALNRPDRDDALDVLSKLGGFEIAGLAGVVLGSAAARVPVVVDGFIAATAALAAARLCPPAADALIASHRSVEVGHGRVLDALGLVPLLDLDLRLGEGTGAALAMPLIDAALLLMRDMATFAAAGVSDSGA